MNKGLSIKYYLNGNILLPAVLIRLVDVCNLSKLPSGKAGSNVFTCCLDTTIEAGLSELGARVYKL